jgi:DNA-binding MarR family transcriptional regulator
MDYSNSTRSIEDERSVLVQLTEKGSKLKEKPNPSLKN